MSSSQLGDRSDLKSDVILLMTRLGGQADRNGCESPKAHWKRELFELILKAKSQERYVQNAVRTPSVISSA